MAVNLEVNYPETIDPFVVDSLVEARKTFFHGPIGINVDGSQFTAEELGVMADRSLIVTSDGRVKSPLEVVITAVEKIPLKAPKLSPVTTVLSLLHF